MKTDDKTLISALRILATDIQSDDGVANACIEEAANRIEEMVKDMVEALDLAVCDDSKWVDSDYDRLAVLSKKYLKYGFH